MVKLLIFGLLFIVFNSCFHDNDPPNSTVDNSNVTIEKESENVNKGQPPFPLRLCHYIHQPIENSEQENVKTHRGERRARRC